MNRILAVLALGIAVGVAGAASYELTDRTADDPVALPTDGPSPSATPFDSPSPLDSPTDIEAPDDTATPRRTQAAASTTAAPEPSETEEPDPTDTPDPTETPQPPRTPTPVPTAAAGPVDTGQGKTPHTGGDSWPAGTALAFAALGLRFVLLRRRSY